jgi:hypothetical protein
MTDICPTCKAEMKPASIIETSGVKSEVLICPFCGKLRHTLWLPEQKPISVANKVEVSE